MVKISGGDLLSDGKANEVVEEVLMNPALLKQLLDGLTDPDDMVRGRAAHAVEGVSRKNQDPFRRLMPQLISLSMNDRVPMVRWHFAMIFGNMASTVKDIEPVVSVLFRMLNDKSVFVGSWAIPSLCII